MCVCVCVLRSLAAGSKLPSLDDLIVDLTKDDARRQPAEIVVDDE